MLRVVVGEGGELSEGRGRGKSEEVWTSERWGSRLEAYN